MKRNLSTARGQITENFLKNVEKDVGKSESVRKSGLSSSQKKPEIDRKKNPGRIVMKNKSRKNYSGRQKGDPKRSARF